MNLDKPVDPDTISAKEVAEIIGVKRVSTVSSMAARGTIPSWTDRNRRWYSRKRIVAIVKERGKVPPKGWKGLMDLI